ncbi:hypothetical protein [Virgisporangium aurantiacum]|uniref:Integral membrane protein n=1 Tax=Virgisporangium aurantiacum TaxID=175570 RepID=A0A8J4E867_9ACTN|nr:hypothetical protein [Virgisporangium aurantiacum]GIJ64933.1 hypothetical protein Vau01_124490 [Virgisporangium aurantiacum]
MGQFIELRIHGVSNTPPEKMLSDSDREIPMIRLHFGDEQTGFYRRASEPDGAPVLTEAYSWGQLTSGQQAKKDVLRAGWALLFPFALANVALWAGPVRARRWADHAEAFLVRLFAIGLTMTMMMAVAGVGMDQVGWQCRDGCPRAVPGTTFLQSGFLSHGLRPVAVGALAPIVVLLLLWLLARRSFAYEATVPASRPPDAPGGASPLQHASFWSGDGQVRRLGALHAAAALIAVGGMALLAGHRVDTGDMLSKDAQGWATRLDLPALGTLAASLALVLITLCRAEIRERAAVNQPVPRYGAWVTAAFWLALLGAALAVAYLVPDRTFADDHPDQETASDLAGPLPGLATAIWWLFASQLAIVVLLLPAIGFVGRSRDDNKNSAWGGMSAAVLGGFGWAAASLYSAAVLFWVADWLNGAATVSSSASRVEVPLPLQWSALGLSVFMGILLAVVVVGWLTLRWRRGKEYLQVRAADGEEIVRTHERRRAWEVARWRAIHMLVEEQGLGYVGVIAATVAVLAALGTLAAWTGDSPVQWADQWFGPGLRFAIVKWLTDTGSALAALLVLGLAALVGAAYRSAGLRRTIGTVWDVTTFWPRGAHPFAPPCYGERAIPQLVTRICGAKEDQFVLAGHSHGAVLAIATVLQLPKADQRRVFLLTFGTQLTPLYGRIFPVFFGMKARLRLAKLLEPQELRRRSLRWRSLYRLTDPIGWPIGDPEVDEGGMVEDPDNLEPTGGEVLDPAIRQHSNYPCSGRYKTSRDRAVEVLRAALDEPQPEPQALAVRGSSATARTIRRVEAVVAVVHDWITSGAAVNPDATIRPRTR